jgi:hypothetical protein
MVYIGLLVGVTVGLLAWAFRRKEGVYEFPFLAGGLYAGWLLPQVIGLVNNPFLPEGGMERFAIMAILSGAMILLGYVWPKEPLRLFDWQYDYKKLENVAIILATIGTLFFIAIQQLPEVYRTGAGRVSGPRVALLFFATLLSYGFAVALLTYAHTKSKRSLWITLLSGGVFLWFEVISVGKRGNTATFLVMVALAFWFAQRKVVPRTVVLTVLIAGFIFNQSVSDYRQIARDADGPTVEEVLSIPWMANVGDQLVEEEGTEVEAAAYQMAAVNESGGFDLGLFHWNRMVFTYVPAQLLGNSFKQSLYLTPTVKAQSRNQSTYLQFNYDKQPGLTTTGMTDAYISFWYLGAIKFFVIAFLIAKMFKGANRGNVTAQLLCMLLMVPAIHAISHNTNWFFEPWVHMGVFLLLPLIYARSKRND